MSAPQQPPPEPQPRPALSPAMNGVSTGIATNVAIIVLWIVGVHLPKDMPDNVHDAVNFIVNTTVAFGVGFVLSYVGAYLRDSQFAATGQVTGLKKLLALPLALLLFGTMACSSVSGPKPAPSSSGLPIPPNATAQQAYQIAWLAFTAARAGAEVYCASPQGASTPVCQEAKAILPIATAAVDAVQPALAQGVPSDVVYTGTKDTLAQATVKLDAAAKAGP